MACIRPVRTHNLIKELSSRLRRLRRKPKSAAGMLNIYDFGQHRFHLCEQPLLRMDKETQAKIDSYHLQNGWTFNEVRAEHDLPAVEGGDEPMGSANLMTLKALMAKADAATQLKPGNYTVGEPPKEGKETT